MAASIFGHGRMPDHDDASQIERMFGRDVSEMVDAARDIEIPTGPSGPGFS